MADDGTARDFRRRLATQRTAAFETALVVGGLALFLVLLYDLHTPAPDGGLLNPPLIAAAGAILLWPLRRHRTVRAILLSGGFLVLTWLFVQLKVILLPFVLVYLLAYLFDPLVSYLRQRFRMPRWVPSLLVTALAVSLVGLFALLLVPNLFSQLETLATRLLGSLGDLRAWLLSAPFMDTLADLGIDKNEVVAQLTTTIQDQLTDLTGRIPTATQSLIRSLGSLLSVLVVVSITPVLLFYTLRDYPFIKRRLIELFPTFGGRRDYLVKAGGVVGNYLRGQLTISAIAAFNVSLLLYIGGVPFALLIGLLGGLLNMIPNLGIIVTNIVGVLLAVTFGDPWLVKALIVVVVLLMQSLLESTVLTPNILSYHVGLHPVLIVLALFVFGYFMGVFGLLIAVPTTALLQMGYRAYREELTLDLARYNEGPRGASDGDAAPAETPPR
ncbi:AI-2E family transporter [Rhodothermaceae bacterium RA]|nr:AI-2E family transporter [Rhodothermaceae bacterium RA]